MKKRKDQQVAGPCQSFSEHLMLRKPLRVHKWNEFRFRPNWKQVGSKFCLVLLCTSKVATWTSTSLKRMPDCHDASLCSNWEFIQNRLSNSKPRRFVQQERAHFLEWQDVTTEEFAHYYGFWCRRASLTAAAALGPHKKQNDKDWTTRKAWNSILNERPRTTKVVGKRQETTCRGAGGGLCCRNRSMPTCSSLSCAKSILIHPKNVAREKITVALAVGRNFDCVFLKETRKQVASNKHQGF